MFAHPYPFLLYSQKPGYGKCIDVHQLMNYNENLVHLPNGMLFSYKAKMKTTGKWMGSVYTGHGVLSQERQASLFSFRLVSPSCVINGVR